MLDMSTIEPDESRAVAAEFAKAGSIMLDGPLSGSPVTVKAGNASVMIGGDERQKKWIGEGIASASRRCS
jgi:3-hydroxyisobutyrate dehydrogenase-like beta-hydroxyacid dehydrogenase